MQGGCKLEGWTLTLQRGSIACITREAVVAAEVAANTSKETKDTNRIQDTNTIKKHCSEDNFDAGCGGGSGGGDSGSDGDSDVSCETASEDKACKDCHYHRDETPQYNHSDNASDRQLQSNGNHHKQGHRNEDAYQLMPADGGWGWMVVTGTFIIMTLLPMLGSCFGVMFSEYLVDAGSSFTTTAWIFNLQGFLCNLSGLLALPLTQEFGWRPVALTGCTMAAVGVMLSAFTPNPYFLFFSFSVLTGVGAGMLIWQCFTILPHYFLRCRGIANAIMTCGICMGQFVGPPIARLLHASYGFRGATLILGAVVLNACVGASSFDPFEWHQKKVPLKKEDLHEDTTILSTRTRISDLAHAPFHSLPKSSFPGKEAVIDNELGEQEKLERLERQTISNSSPKWSSRYNSTKSLPLHVRSLEVLPVEEKEKAEDGMKEGRRDIQLFKIAKLLIRELGALKSLRVCILCLGDSTCLIVYLNFLMMVPFSMAEAELSVDTSAWCISMSAVCSMVSRFLVSALTDWPRFNNKLAYVYCLGLTASSILGFTFMSSMEGLTVMMALYGIGVGVSMGIYPIIIMDVMGAEYLGRVFGISCFVAGVGSLCIGPVIGFIRGVTQSYAASMRFTSAILFVPFIMWHFMGLAESVDRRREQRKN